VVPIPGDEYVTLPALALAWSMKPRTDIAGDEIDTARMFGKRQSSEIGARSVSES